MSAGAELLEGAPRPTVGASRLLRPWIVEAFALAGLYVAGELSRGFVRGGPEVAERHAADVVRLERSLHVFGEAAVQRATHHVAGLPTLLGYAYVTCHLAVTVAVLVWAYRRHADAYPRLRNAYAVATAIAVAGYALFPTAPPRLAGVGIADTVSGATGVDLDSALVSALYNPYAAVPSMHVGFAILAGAAIWRLGRGPARAVGLLYPLFVLLVIVATGNHFFFDAAAGAAVAVAAAGLVAAADRRGARVRIAAPEEA